MLLLVDNRDSFTYNLAQYFLELGQEVRVVRASQLDWRGVQELAPAAIVTGPGPGHPEDAQLSIELAQRWQGPLLGVCLGHQAMALAAGAEIVRCGVPWHGRASAMQHDGTGLFAGLPNPLTIGRYHSLTVQAASLPDDLHVNARTPDGEVQAITHRGRAHFGVQFHPESILSEHGRALLRNFLDLREPKGSKGTPEPSSQTKPQGRPEGNPWATGL